MAGTSSVSGQTLDSGPATLRPGDSGLWCTGGQEAQRLTVSVVLLAEWLRGGLAVAVLLAPVVLLLAQVLL